MDLDLAFVSALVRNGQMPDVQEIIYSGLDPEWMQDDTTKTITRFVLDYAKTHKALPSADFVEARFGVKLLQVIEPVGVYKEQVLGRKLSHMLAGAIAGIKNKINAGEPQAAYDLYQSGLQAIRSLRIADARTVPLLSLGQKVLDHYDMIKAGGRGVQCPWPGINEATLGFWPEDFVLFVSRLGVGKTQTLVLIMQHAFRVNKKRVLFITTEMSQLAILRRFYAVDLKIPNKDIREGRVALHVEDKMRKHILDSMTEEGLSIVGGEFDFKMTSVEAAIQEFEPELLIIDGVYLLKIEGDSRTDKAANLYDEVKRVAKRNKVPLVVSTQFNRNAKVNNASSLSVENIAQSDVAGWNADVIYALEQTDDMKRDRRLTFRPAKMREGVGLPVECNWNFDTMDFSQLPTASSPTIGRPGGSSGGSGASGGSFDPDPFATGLGLVPDEDAPF